MYTHARQFPHLAGLPDSEIREIARRAMSRHSNLIRTMRIRKVAVLLGMLLCVGLMSASSGKLLNGDARSVGITFMIVGGALTGFLFVWNLVWLNTVTFRITREEIDRKNA